MKESMTPEKEQPIEYRQPIDRRFDLLDPRFIDGMAHIMAIGAKKYGENKWQGGLTGVHSGLNHAHKHLNEYQADVPNDYGEREYHLYQTAVNCMFEAYFLRLQRQERLLGNQPGNSGEKGS